MELAVTSFIVFFKVGTSGGFGVFWKLLIRWKGSIYKVNTYVIRIDRVAALLRSNS